MEIAIIGYGRMGKEIEHLAPRRGIGVRSTIDPREQGARFKEITEEALEGVEVAVEFTGPQAAVSNIQKAAELGVNLVVGTTGWHGEIKKVRAIVEETGIGFIHASNFSVGVNVFYEIVRSASKIFNKLTDYDVYCHETHHFGKADSPSGTARKIGQILLDNIARKEEALYNCLDRKRHPEELHVSSTRGGWVPGTHKVVFDSEFDSVERVHRTRSRRGLAAGALRAAQWISGKKGFFELSDLLRETLGL